VDWFLRDIIYRLGLRCYIEGVLHHVPALLDKIREDIKHVEEVIQVAELFRERGWVTFLLEPAQQLGDVLAIKGTHVLLIEVKTHPPPWRGMNPEERDLYMSKVEELRTRAGIDIIYTWFDQAKKQWFYTCIDNLEETPDGKIVAKKVEPLIQLLKMF